MAGPLELSGKQAQQLADIIAALFDDYTAVSLFTWTKLDLKLARIVEASGLDTVAFKLVEWAEKTGKVADLVNQLWLKKSSDQQLTDLAAALAIPLREQAAFEPGALGGLETAAENPATRTAMQRYRGDIVNLCDATQKLGALKFLHDRVDAMRRTVYVPLGSVLARLPSPETRGELREYRTSFEALFRDIGGKITEAGLSETEVPWLEESLVPAQGALGDAALNWPDAAPLRAAVSGLENVTGPQLADINGQIKGRADGMARLGFADRMAAMQADIAADLPSDADREQLADDLDRLSAAITNLCNLVIEHDRWQRIKDLTGNLEDMMNRPVGESKYAWPTLKKLLDTVAKGAIYPPPDALVAAKDNVTTTFETPGLDQNQPSNALANAADGLRSFVGDQFFVVDKNLLNECGYVGKLGDRLREVLGALNG